MKTIDKIQKLYYDTFYDGKPPLELLCKIKLANDIYTFIRKDSTGNMETLESGYITIKPRYAEILGKPIDILDVLRLFRKINTKELTGLYIEDNGGLWKKYGEFNHNIENRIVIFDLSKKLIREQSQEVIEKVGKLLFS